MCISPIVPSVRIFKFLLINVQISAHSDSIFYPFSVRARGRVMMMIMMMTMLMKFNQGAEMKFIVVIEIGLEQPLEWELIW